MLYFEFLSRDKASKKYLLNKTNKKYISLSTYKIGLK